MLINGPVLNKVVINGSSAVTQSFTKALTILSTSTVQAVKRVGKFITTNASTSSTSLVRAARKIISKTVTSTFTDTLSIIKTITATLVASNDSLFKQVGKIVFKGYNIIYPSTINSTNWIYVFGDNAFNTATAPDGTQTADTLTIPAAAGTYTSPYIGNLIVQPNTQYTYSVYVKLGTLPQSEYKFAVYQESTVGGFIGVDLIPSVLPTTTNWTRVTYTFTTPSTCVLARMYAFRNSSVVTGGTVYLWGAQLEKQAIASPYIGTTSYGIYPTTNNITKYITKFVTKTVTSLVTDTLSLTKTIVSSAIINITSLIKSKTQYITAVSTNLVSLILARIYYKNIITNLSVSVNTLQKTITKLIVTTLVTSIKSLIKSINKRITTNLITNTTSITKRTLKNITTTLVSSIKTLVKRVNKFIKPTVTSIVTLIYGKFLYKVLTIVTTVSVSLDKAFIILLFITVTGISSLIKTITKVFSINVLNIFTLIANYIQKYGAIFRDSLYAPIRKRLITLVHERTLEANSMRDRLTYLVKFRSITKRKDTDG